MTIQRTIQTYLIGIAVAGILASAVPAFFLKDIRSSFNEFTNRRLLLYSDLKDVYALGLQRGQAVRNVILNKNDKTARENFERAVRDVRGRLKDLNELTAGTEMQRQIQAVASLTERDIQLQHYIIDHQGDGMEASVGLIREKETPLWRDSKTILLRLIDEVGESFHREEGVIQKSSLIGFVVSIAMMVLFMLLMGIMHNAFTKRTLHTIHDLSGRVKDLAEGDGDLTKRIQANRKDEMGVLGGYFNNFIVKIQQIVVIIADRASATRKEAGDLHEASRHLEVAVQEISSREGAIAESAQEMSENLKTLASSLEEISITTTEIAKRASSGADKSTVAIRHMTDTEKAMGELENWARQIDRVVQAIVDISARTKLLALNASIEAAGAGSAGKGFAVVATEVKELAAKTEASSEEIKDMIHNVQSRVQSTSSFISQATLSMRESGEITSSIAAMVEEQSITSREISRNVLNVSTAASEITKNITNVSSAVADAARDSGTVSRLAAAMNHLSGRLNDIVSMFKV